jgi:hypothetical protein
MVCAGWPSLQPSGGGAGLDSAGRFVQIHLRLNCDSCAVAAGSVAHEFEPELAKATGRVLERQLFGVTAHGTEETANRVGGLSVCWGGADALAQMQDRRHCKEAMLAAIDLAKEPCNSRFLVNGLEFSRTTTPSGITIVGCANREQLALSRLQVSFNKL